MTTETRTSISLGFAAIAVVLSVLGALSDELSIMVWAIPFALAAAYVQIFYKRN